MPINTIPRGKTLGDDVDLSKIAHTTIGFTGADLENLLNEAAIACAKDGRSFISQEDVDKSLLFNVLSSALVVELV